MFLPYIAPSLRTGLPHIYKGNNRYNSENKFWDVPFDWSVLRSMPQGYIFNVLFQGNPTWPCSIVHCTSPNSQKTNIWLFCVHNVQCACWKDEQGNSRSSCSQTRLLVPITYLSLDLVLTQQVSDLMRTNQNLKNLDIDS